MASLAEVYERVKGRSRKRLYLGTGLFAAGTLAVVVAIVFATTDLLAAVGIGVFGARKFAGVLAGLGIPAVFVGVFTVMPASARERATAVIGASIAIFGVALFWYAYPSRWLGATPDHLTLPVVAVYFFGTITTFWSMFVAVTNFKTRNDPGGMLRLERTVDGDTRVIEVPREESTGGKGDAAALGGVGVVGSVDRDEVARRDVATSDGGTDAEVIQSPEPSTTDTAVGSPNDADPSGPMDDTGTAATGMTARSDPADASDRYCGTCTHFDYIQTESGMRPYCGYYDEQMSDMEACEQWDPNLKR
ncbi:MAG: hypothetical protein ABEI76_07610 [Halobacteriales archaeon]